MVARDIVVVGASAGGVDALQELVGSLPSDLPVAVFVVLHLPANYVSGLASILTRSGPLPATHATDGERIEPGKIYVANPNFHLLVGAGFVSVTRGPRVNRARPAIDLLFQSAAAAYGERVVGIVLSGMMDDGTRGLATIKQLGGYAIAQDPDDALFAGMPRSAIDDVAVDRILPVAEMGQVLRELASKPAEGLPLVIEQPSSNGGSAPEGNGNGSHEISPFTCPDCGGTLWEMQQGKVIHYQCRVGHAYSPSNLLEAQVDTVEAHLWASLRAMEEREAIYRTLLKRNTERGGIATIQSSIEGKIETNHRHAEMLRQILLDEEPAT